MDITRQFLASTRHQDPDFSDASTEPVANFEDFFDFFRFLETVDSPPRLPKSLSRSRSRFPFRFRLRTEPVIDGSGVGDSLGAEVDSLGLIESATGGRIPCERGAGDYNS